MTTWEVAVVGSGPSAVAAIEMLIRRGLRPHVIDAGDVKVESGPTIKKSGDQSIASKMWFGSDATYLQPPESVLEYTSDVGARASFQLGGFSRIWGATVEFDNCTSVFPSSICPTENNLEVVRQLLPSSMTTFSDVVHEGEVRGHHGFRPLFLQLQQNSRQMDCYVEPSRLAINSRSGPSACTGCHQCFAGCPVDAIWFAGNHINAWIKAGLIIYHPRSHVLQLSESDHAVHLTVSSRGKTFQLSTQRLILAAGAVSSSALLVNSSICRSLILRDTSAIYGGALTTRNWCSSEVIQHALSQIWIRKPGMFFAQLYAPDTQHLLKLQQRMPRLPGVSMAIARRLIGRIIPIIVMMDSSLSGSLNVRKTGNRVLLEAKTNSDFADHQAAALQFLRQVLRGTGLVLPKGRFEVPPVGTSQHVGASIPHLVASDTLGRPLGLRRTHVVDGSVLPGLPLGSFAPVMMANAVRITSQLPIAT